MTPVLGDGFKDLHVHGNLWVPQCHPQPHEIIKALLRDYQRPSRGLILSWTLRLGVDFFLIAADVLQLILRIAYPGVKRNHTKRGGFCTKDGLNIWGS